MRRFQIPKIIHRFYPELLWKENVTSKEIYLTFDDGPHPDVTPKVLNILSQFDAKACFFCVGENILKYPETFNLIKKSGHQIGNHTFNHLKGWETPDADYISNVTKCDDFVKSPLFRPPYGRIKKSQINKLKNDFKIVMWSVLTYDYDRKITEKECLNIAIKNTFPGAVVVFHDSEKAQKNMLYALPGFLEYFSKKDYKFVTWK